MSRKRKHVKRLLFFWPLILVVCIGYVVYAFTAPLAALEPTPTFTYSKSSQTVSLAWPSYGEAAVGAVGDGVLATHGAETPLPTASAIKILTALSVLKEKPLSLNEEGPVITLTQADVDSYNKYFAEGGSVVAVQVGEQLSEYQALQALLLPSANNIAETLANWAFGSIDSYNTFADSYAQQLGMTNTTVTDPSGFLPTTMSTPEDLTILGEAALTNPVIAQIVDMPSSTIPVQGTIYNVDGVLGQDGIIGIKTGNNDQDTGCFMFAADKPVGNQTITVVGTIMGGPNLATTMHDSLPLIDSTAAGFSDETIVQAGTNVGSYDTPWGDPVAAVAGKTLTGALWTGTATSISVNMNRLHVPLATNSQIGTLTINNSTLSGVDSVPIVIKQAVAKPSIFWRLLHTI